MRKHNLVPGNIYHVYNRGVEKRQIFLDNRDYARFIKGMTVFNDSDLVFNFEERFRAVLGGSHEREPLVDIMAFCLMPNHFHLLLKQKTEFGVSEFMKKLGGGYTNYFNLKNERVGALFQGKFKSVWIGRDSHFLYMPHYIHLNPLDLCFPGWRKRGVSRKDTKRAIDFLSEYEWSSYSDYTGKNNFNVVLSKAWLEEYFSEDEYRKDLIDYVTDPRLDPIDDLLLE